MKESQPPKPKVPKAGIEDFPENVQTDIREMIIKIIKAYMSQAKRIPTDKTRTGHIKNILSGFNSKQWKPYEKRMDKSKALLDLYDEIKHNIGTTPDIKA
jgi:hypothetical protein